MGVRRTIAAGVLFCVVSPALAQGPSVGAALTGDIVRFSRSETQGVRDLSGGGEAAGVALRVDTPIGSSWGVEAEFARPAVIEHEGAPDVIPLAYRGVVPLPVVTTSVVTGELPAPLIYPPISYTIRTSQRHTTFSTGIWARRVLSARASLAFSGGVGFHRTATRAEFTYGPFRGIPSMPIVIPPAIVTETTAYSARPYVGLDARIDMTDNVELLAGVRLHGLRDGMLVRPGVGLAWVF